MKISKHLSKKLTKKIEGDLKNSKVKKTFEEALDKTFLNIANALITNKEKKQTIIKKDGTFNKLFLKVLKIDETIFTDKIKKELAQEMIEQVQLEGYIKFDICVLTFKENKLIMVNPNE